MTLASLHAAKGLEWDAVFLVGLTDGTMPIQHAETPEEVEEERRLFYVGVTRARTRLALSWALSRTEGGRRTRRRSRFLTGIAPDSATPEPAAAHPADAGSAVAGCSPRRRSRSAGAPTARRRADPELVDALRTWRKARSTEASVPAFVVFSDATLLAIAERRPTDNAALLAIPGIGRASWTPTARTSSGSSAAPADVGSRASGCRLQILSVRILKFLRKSVARSARPTLMSLRLVHRRVRRVSTGVSPRGIQSDRSGSSLSMPLRLGGVATQRRCRMYNMTKISGWLGTGVVDLARIGGPATADGASAPRAGCRLWRPPAIRRSGVQQLA